LKLVDTQISFSATDLANHMACGHLSQLERKRALGQLEKPHRKNAFLERIIERGLEHEKAYVNHLKGMAGQSVLEIEFGDKEAHTKTFNAMKSGIGIIFQGALANEHWGGRPDLLVRVDTPSPKLGSWSYQAADTKLTQTTKAGTILQLCVYSDLIAELQGTDPELMIVVMPNEHDSEPFTTEQHRYDNYAAYYRQAKAKLLTDIPTEGITSGDNQADSKTAHLLPQSEPTYPATYPEPTYPELVSHCDICQWWPDCDKRRRDDDHLSFIAGIQKSQIKELVRQGHSTLTAFATSVQPLKEHPATGGLAAFKGIHQQAKIQHKGITTGQPEFDFIEVSYPEPGDNNRRRILKATCTRPQW